jgi:hypothetical protein
MPLAVDMASAARSDEAETASWHGTIEGAGVEMGTKSGMLSVSSTTFPVGRAIDMLNE